MNQPTTIRNFSIIAHIDHGKTTLTDRFLEKTSSIEKRLMHERFLDSHPISQEKGVTIKLAPVRMKYRLSKKMQKDFHSKFFILNLIDTPGHIDFAYEVSRSLLCCEGAILLVDASSGPQAQTLSNFNEAQKLGLKIIPVINKIDLPGAEIEKTKQSLINNMDFQEQEILFISAKTGKNVNKVLETVVKQIPPPEDNSNKKLRALVFDSFYDTHLGVVIYVRIVDGSLQEEKLTFISNKHQFEPQQIGYLQPKMIKTKKLQCGEVGYIATGLKNISLCNVGDTVTTPNSKVIALPGYKEPKPVVFFDFYPVENQDYPVLKEAIEKIKLNDASLDYQTTGFPDLGKGLRMGFLGPFHAEITQEKIERDFGINVVVTTPSVVYKIILNNKKIKKIHHASQLPQADKIKDIKEPWIRASIFIPVEYIGDVFNLLEHKRGEFESQKYFGKHINIIYNMPLIELVEGFYSQLKSASSGFASFEYKITKFKAFKAVKMEILINKEKVDALSFIMEEEKARKRASKIAKKLKEIIPKQLFEVPIQVAVNNQIIARETIKAFRKDVTAKLYGGDQTRKDKLLKKQKKGKRRLKKIGQVDIPQDAFLSVLEV